MQNSRPRSWQEWLVTGFKRSVELTDEQSFWVLKDINFEIYPGETISIIGSNGAGKSTMLKLLTHIIRPTTGTIEINGRISALLELGAGFHPDLTGRENIYLNGAILGLTHDDLQRKLDEIVDFAELERFLDVPVRNYSSGMYVRLGFAVAVHTNPEILVVDEVLAVGDAAFQRKCMDRIYQMRRQGVTIILVTHDMGTVERMCERAIWLYKGKIEAMGDTQTVANEYNRFSYQAESPLANVVFNEIEDENEETNEEQEENLFEEGESTDEPQPQQRWGSGEIRIEQVRLLNQANQTTDRFETGQPLIVELTYQADERIERPIFGMAIHRNDGTHVTGPNTRFAEQQIPFVEGKGSVQYTIPALPLLEGMYQISVAVHNWEDTVMFDYHHLLYPFQTVQAGNEKYGLITMGGRWTWQNGHHPPTES